MNAQTTWSRGLDAKGRIFTIGVLEQRARLYYPDEDGEMFWVASGHHGLGRGDASAVRFMREDFDVEGLEELCHQHEIVLPIPSRRTPGEYFPRIWLGPETPHPRDVGLLAPWMGTVRAARNLYAHMRDVFRTIEPVEAHANVYSDELRQLLILACTEVENGWKAILRANGYSPLGNENRWSVRDYSLLRDPLGLDLYAVELSNHPRYGELQPFADWGNEPPNWYTAYNRVKHDREGELHRATLGHVINAMAAVFILTIAQFGPLTVQRGEYFHPDEFSLLRYPRGVLDPGRIAAGRTVNPPEIGDWYIRPLPPLTQDSGSWPTEWHTTQHPRVAAAMAERAVDARE